ESRNPVGWGQIAPVFCGFILASGLQQALSEKARWRRYAALTLGVLAVVHSIHYIHAFPISFAAAPDYRRLKERAEFLSDVRNSTDSPRAYSFWGNETGVPLLFDLPSPAGHDPLAPRRVDHLLSGLQLHLGLLPKDFSSIVSKPEVLSLLGV